MQLILIIRHCVCGMKRRRRTIRLYPISINDSISGLVRDGRDLLLHWQQENGAIYFQFTG
jgi:hypothetical protein